ncbi:histidine phosphatase family protein [Rhizobium lemnae]|uniref:SixA phosphatase family protein n=1 Tax=Rhizobium lemnae TaxID=1214924 RepID=A0ABV8E9A9_9HYPH|nr:histidine phosphatase family protein [Rhizobium lemnae]MCJ8509880.1 histidine phosphatase family protein [Rhizobium lemnae]
MEKPNPPPFEIYLMRHAHSGWPQPGERDFDRALDARGIAEANAVARMTASSGYRPDLLLCSSAHRCRGTAASVIEAINEEMQVQYLDELYNAPVETYLAIIRAQTVARLMVIGHNPSIEVLLETMIGSDPTASIIPAGFPTAGFAALGHDPRSGSAQGPWQLGAFFAP